MKDIKVELPDKKLRWAVGLSNGTVMTEDDEIFVKQTDKSRWASLKEFLVKNNLTVNSLCLLTPDNTSFNLPTVGNTPRFKQFSGLENPLSFNFFRMLGSEIGSGKADYLAVIEAIYEKKRVQIWVSEEDSFDSWVLVLDN